MEGFLPEEQETADSEHVRICWHTSDALAPASIRFIGSDDHSKYTSSLGRLTVNVLCRVLCKLVSTRISHSLSSASSNNRHGKYLDCDYSHNYSRLFLTATFTDAGHGGFCEGCISVVLYPIGITTGRNHVGGYNRAALGVYESQGGLCDYSWRDRGGCIVFVDILKVMLNETPTFYTSS